MHSFHRTVSTLAVAAVLITSCSSNPIAGPATSLAPDGTPRRIALDPEQYVLDYPELEYEADGSAGASAAPSTSATTGEVAPPTIPTIFDDNTFVDPGDGPFKDVSTEPTSTFGLDVDTGSFSVGRTFLTEGTLPPAASVRTEEWVNALGSLQEAPADGDLGVQIDGSSSPLSTGNRLLRVGVAARDVAPDERPAANLTFVVDTSGSMDIRERLGLVKASLGLLVLNLRDDDSISIVEYSDDAAVLLEPTKVVEARKIVDAIDRLQPSNSTNLEAGLRAGYEQAEFAFVDDGINAVILASDGVANVGMTGPDGLTGEIAQQATDGISLVTVGYGMGNYNDDLMEQLADQGDGFYSYLDTYAQAQNLFEDRLTSTLAVVSGDAKAQVDFEDGLATNYRLVGYENRALDDEDFTDDSVDAGEIGAGHRVTALYEVQFPDFAVAPEPDALVATASLRSRSVATAMIETIEAPVTYGDLTPDAGDAPADLRMQAATAAFAEWLAGDRAEGSPDLAEITVLAADAASELSGEGMPGSAVTPEEMVDLMELAATATPAPEPAGEPGS